MEKLPRARYSQEFKEQAVQMALVEGIGTAEVARRLSLSPKTLANWIHAYRNDAKKFRSSSAVSEEVSEMSRLRRENALLKMECDILKKAAALFAKGSL